MIDRKNTGIRVRHCALAAVIALALAPVASVLAQDVGSSQVSGAQAEQQYQFNIPSKPLPQAIADLSAVTGLQVLYTEQSSFDHTAPALQGNYSVRDALQQLLAGSGLVMRFTGDNSVTIELASQDGLQTLPPVRISGETIADGSAESGYVSEEVSQVGPWQWRSLQDTPYSINVVSEDLIENLQATTTDQVFKINPVIQMTNPQNKQDLPYIYMRGFRINQFGRNGNTRVGGNWHYGTMTEDIERIEVLTGLSGFLYGNDNIGGVVNIVTKRPTETRLNNFTAGNTTGQNLYLHADLGGPIDTEGKFGYRINMVTQEGETHVDHVNVDRDSISAAFDWHVSEKLLVTMDFSRREYQARGKEALWVVNEGVDRPDPDTIDPARNWGQKWSFNNTDSERIEFSGSWEISDSVNLRSRYLRDYNEHYYVQLINFITSPTSYDQLALLASSDAADQYYGESAFAYVDFDFSIGSVNHKLTAGVRYSDTYRKGRSNPYADPVNFPDLLLNEPQYQPEPEWTANTSAPIQTDKNRSRTITVGDDITLNQQWSALVGFSRSQITNGSYDESDLTPSLSLIYKPLENITTYLSYMEALEQGGTADNQYNGLSVVNAGEVMEPLTSEQVEFGIKANMGDLLLTASLFEIDKPLEYYEELNGTQAVFIQDGRQVHKGFEFTATGKLYDNLTVVGGITLLDAKTRENKESPELEGKTPVVVAEQMYKLYLEYTVNNVPGLTITGGINHTHDFYGDSLNTDSINGYTVADLGARYSLSVADKPITFRFNINNATDKRYWINNITLGDPRTVTFSASLQF